MAATQKIIFQQVQQAASLMQKLCDQDQLLTAVEQAATVCIDCLRSGGRIIFAGNGGSAADAQHFAAELVGRFYIQRDGLAAMSLTTDTSMLTAIGNDFGFAHIFARQLQANAKSGDVFIAMSTSGNSENLLLALDYCKQNNMTGIGMTGDGGGKMASKCDILIAVPETSTPRIQEAHTVFGHALCAKIEAEMFTPS